MMSNHGQGYLFLANILSTVKIEKLSVPEVVQSGSTVVLDCRFAAPGDFTVQWWFGAGAGADSSLVYEWRPHAPPIVAGVLDGRVDLTSTVSDSEEKYRAIRLLRVDPELSGEYTCVVTSNGAQAREAKRMLVFSPEEEFELTIRIINDPMADITCIAYGVYPQPQLTLEYEKEPISQQVERVWHMNSLKYDAESKARLPSPRCGRRAEVTCRLHLPQADYTAIKKRYLSFGEQCSGGRKSNPKKYFCVIIVPLLLIIYHMFTSK